MIINPVSPVQWAGQDAGNQPLRNRFTDNDTVKAAETERPVDAKDAAQAVPAKEDEQGRVPPPSMLQIKIEEMLNSQVDQLQSDPEQDGV